MREDKRMIRAVDGTLDPAEEAEMRARAAQDPELAGRLARWEEVRGLLGGTPDGFEPGFSERVMARIASLPATARRAERPGSELVHAHLVHAFPRLAAACVFGVLALGLYTLLAGAGLHGNALEALLGLPATTLESVLLLAAA
jgi:anti-sigma factor RsiW